MVLASLIRKKLSKFFMILRLFANSLVFGSNSHWGVRGAGASFRQGALIPPFLNALDIFDKSISFVELITHVRSCKDKRLFLSTASHLLKAPS